MVHYYLEALEEIEALKKKRRERWGAVYNNVIKPVSSYVGLKGAAGGLIGFSLAGLVGGLVGIVIGKNTTWKGIKENAKSVSRGIGLIADTYIEAKEYESLHPDKAYREDPKKRPKFEAPEYSPPNNKLKKMLYPGGYALRWLKEGSKFVPKKSIYEIEEFAKYLLTMRRNAQKMRNSSIS